MTVPTGLSSLNSSPAGKSVIPGHVRNISTCSIASLLFDMELDALEEEHECPVSSRSFRTGRCTSRSPRALLLQELVRAARNGPASKLWQHALQARESACNENGEVDLHKFSQELADAGHFIWLRTGTSFSVPELGQALRHTFVVAALPSSGIEPRYVIVDPEWKPQVQVAGASEDYDALLGLLPDVFVGTAQQLDELVKLLCTEMENAFTQRGLPCPLWRQHSAMAARWLVTSAEDTRVYASPAAAGASART